MVLGKTWRPGAVCFLSAVLAACGAASTPAASGAQTVMIAAATRSEAASTFHISATARMTSLSGSPLIPANRASLSGDVDLSTGSAHLKGMLLGISTKPGAAPLEISFEVIQIGNDSWESTSGLGGLLQLGDSLPPGHWIKDESSSSVSQFPDPGKLFDALKSNASTVRFVGKGTVDGVGSDEYQLVGPPDLFAHLGGGTSDRSEATGPISVLVWVDRAGLVRRLSTTFKQNMGPPGQVESIALIVDFTRYGEPLHVTPPPADLVVPNPNG